MRIIITGTPGTGKTTVAKALARQKNHLYINEHDFCMRHGIGKIDRKTMELEVPAKEYEKAAKKVLAKERNFFLEGHLSCEIKIPVDLVIVLTCSRPVLEKRLEKKGYSDEKILDNLQCEAQSYCLKKAMKNFGAKKLLEVENSKGIKKTLFIINKAFDKIFSNGGY